MKFAVLLITLLFALALWIWYGPETEASFSAGVSVQVASRSAISEVVNATGVIKPRNGAEVRVGSRISGVLEKLHVDVGDEVQGGQLLAELDAAELQGNLKVIRSRVQELEAQLAYSRLLLERNRTVAILPKTEIANLEKEVAINASRLLQAQDAVLNEELRLSWTRVTAPISGTIASVSTQQGETIAASFAAPTFLTIIDLTRLEIQAYVDEADIGKIHSNQQVRFAVDTYPGVSFEGQVKTIYPKAAIVNNVVNYIVIVDIQVQPQYLLRPEMTAYLQFVIREVADTITIPRSALFSEGDGYYVMLQQSDSWEKRPVQLGIVNSTSVEITGGLGEGSLFVSDRQSLLNASVASPNQ